MADMGLTPYPSLFLLFKVDRQVHERHSVVPVLESLYFTTYFFLLIIHPFIHVLHVSSLSIVTLYSISCFGLSTKIFPYPHFTVTALIMSIVLTPLLSAHLESLLPPLDISFQHSYNVHIAFFDLVI